MIEFHVLTHLSAIVVASYENKIYVAGGSIELAASDPDYTASMLNIQGTSERLAEPFNLDAYIQVMDFSKPVNSSQNSIDISTDNITTAIRLPTYIGDGALFISDGVMHLLPGGWDFNLKTQKLSVQGSGIQYHVNSAVIAFDTENQVGWYYGGIVELKARSFGYSQDLYRLDRGKRTPTKVVVNSSSVGTVLDGELVYLKNIGEAGVLVLIGGTTDLQMVSMMNLKLTNCVIPTYYLTNTFTQRPIDIVHVFDIATNTWFTQRTTAQGKYPSDRARMCSVVASAEDSSSHNIYIYGGYYRGAIGTNGTVINEILVLTLPAFHWILVYPSYCGNGTCDTRRVYGHKCQKVYEKHMVAYRGRNFNSYCDNEERLGKFQGMVIYDMSSLEWTTKVEENHKYLVPKVLYEIIGGE